MTRNPRPNLARGTREPTQHPEPRNLNLEPGHPTWNPAPGTPEPHGAASNMPSRPRRLRALSPAMQARLQTLRRWSTQLDSVFGIPGLGIRFGWDPILGLLPGLGDMVTPLSRLPSS